ncbi:MAG: AAA family ATPase [Planctomycetota bacterium]
MPDPSDADSQLDALIERIQSLSGDADAAVRSPSPPQSQAPPQSRAQASVTSETATRRSGGNRPINAVPSATPAQQATLQSTRVTSPGQTAASPTATAHQTANAPLQNTQGNRNADAANAPNSATVAPGMKANTDAARSRSSLMAADAANSSFAPSRDEPWRPSEPVDLRTAQVNETLLEAIIFRFLLNAAEAEGRRIAQQVQLPFRLVEPILDRMKLEQLVAYKSATATNDYVYVLTETGRAIARNHNKDCTYFGSCPVRLKDYIESVRQQTIEGQYPKRNDLLRAFNDLLINPKMLQRLGPAVASGRGMFLFGFPGNGKTSIAERVTGAFGKYLWIPRAIDVEGDVMRVYDPMNHEMDMPEPSTGLLNSGSYDKRWVRIRRPTIVAGGELTMQMLEVQHMPSSNISESPLQLKSNCGTLVIDDFGRQKMSVDQLLNRWIIPLEKRYDFLNMASGKKIQVPFDQLVIFSTNLEPKDLVDDAFLRRIPYKIEVENPPEADFRKLFEIMCKVTKIPYNFEAIDYLIKTHYLPVDRPFRNCQPRDLLLQVRNYCLYNDLEVELKNEYFDFACENYFSVM